MKTITLIITMFLFAGSVTAKDTDSTKCAATDSTSPSAIEKANPDSDQVLMIQSKGDTLLYLRKQKQDSSCALLIQSQGDTLLIVDENHIDSVTTMIKDDINKALDYISNTIKDLKID